MKTLAQRIRELREEKDLSLRELARKLGVSAPFLSDVELGRRNPSDKVLARLAQVLGASADELRQFDTRPPVDAMRRLTTADPSYGLAFRMLIDKNVSSKDLIEFAERKKKREEPKKRK